MSTEQITTKTPMQLQVELSKDLKDVYLKHLQKYEEAGTSFEVLRLHMNQQLLGLVCTLCSTDMTWPKNIHEQLVRFDAHLEDFCKQGKNLFRELSGG